MTTTTQAVQAQATLLGHRITSVYTEKGRVFAQVRGGAEARVGDLAILGQSDSSDHLRLYRVTEAGPVEQLDPVDGGGHTQRVWLELVAQVVTGRNPSWRGVDRVV